MDPGFHLFSIIILSTLAMTWTAGLYRIQNVPSAAVAVGKDDFDVLFTSLKAAMGSSEITGFRYRRDISYPTLVMRAAIMDTYPERVRREIDNDTLVTELSSWQDDLVVLKKVLSDMKENPHVRALQEEDLVIALDKIEEKLEVLGSLSSSYKLALYSSVVSPDEVINVQQLRDVVRLIEEVNERNYTLPLYNSAIHAVSNLRIGSVQNMVIIQNLVNTKEKLLEMIEFGTTGSLAEKRLLKDLQTQIAHVHDRLLQALNSAGYTTSAEVEELESLDRLVSIVVGLLEESVAFAKDVMELATSSNVIRPELVHQLRKLIQTAQGNETKFFKLPEVSNATQLDQGMMPRAYPECVKGLNIETNNQGVIVAIEGELVTKSLGTKLHTRNWSYDYRGKCAYPSEKQSRRSKRAKDGEREKMRTVIGKILRIVARQVKALRQSCGVCQASMSYYGNCCRNCIEEGV